jgi:hypothetical protein
MERVKVKVMERVKVKVKAWLYLESEIHGDVHPAILLPFHVYVYVIRDTNGMLIVSGLI